MKLIAFLFCATVLLALAAYDYRTLNRVTHALVDIEELGSVLDKRGRERYEIQEHYTEWLGAEVQPQKPLNDFKSVNWRASNALHDFTAAALFDWTDADVRELKQLEVHRLKSRYAEIPFATQTLLENQRAVEAWSNQLVDILDELQNLDVQLSRHLAGSVQKTIVQVAYVNAVGLMLVFATVLASVYWAQRRLLVSSRVVNEHLRLRQEQQEKSRKISLSLMEDLSSEKDAATRLSRQLQQSNEAMQLKNEEMEQFIYTVSHDLKSPLVTIAGFSRKLDLEAGEILHEKQKHYLSRIQANVEHMEQLLSDLLQLSRVIRQDMEKSLIDTNEVVTTQLSILEGTIKESGAEILIHSPLSPIYANGRLLSQCVHNLVGNAIKYRDDARELVIEIRAISDEHHTRLVVSDNGMGIDGKYQQQVFRIFERLGYAEGTGVGLTIVKAVMERHSGSVELESESGVGSKFTLIFPRNKNGVCT